MPTYRHQPTGKRFLFVHIPRTAGRFFEANLKTNNFIVEQDSIWDTVDEVEVAHFHRPLYEKHFDIEGIPHLSIIRNPIDRFFSASIYLKRMYGSDIQESMEDPGMFSSMLQNFPLVEAVNWYRLQVDFLSQKTQVWKLEDRLTSSFAEWVSDHVGVPFKVDAFTEYRTDIDEGVNKLERTDALIKNVKQFCKKDIEQLYPELI